MSKEDYSVMMKTLSGNLAEGDPSAGSAHTPAVGHLPVEQVKATVQGKSEASTESTEAGNNVKVEFGFEIESVVARLYDGSSNLVSTFQTFMANFYSRLFFADCWLGAKGSRTFIGICRRQNDNRLWKNAGRWFNGCESISLQLYG